MLASAVAVEAMCVLLAAAAAAAALSRYAVAEARAARAALCLSALRTAVLLVQVVPYRWRVVRRLVHQEMWP